MMTGRSSCPECGTILRIRDRSFIGRRVNCPECKTTLRIESVDDKGQFVTKRVELTDRVGGKSNRSSGQTIPEPKDSKTTPVWTSIVRIIYSPLTAAWLLAIAVSVLIGVLTLSPKFRFAQTRPNVIRTEPKPPEDSPTIVEPPTVVMETATQVEEVEKVQPQEVDRTPAVSALEPANVEGPLPVPPPMVQKKEEQPVPAVTVKPPPKKDIAALMAQPIAKYSQPKIRLRALLEALNEQLGGQLRYDPQELGEESLEETVSFELVNTTMGDVIKTVAKSAHWNIIVDETSIRLERKHDPAAQ